MDKKRVGRPPNEVEKVSLTFYIEPKMKKAISEIAFREGRTPKWIFIRAMKVYADRFGHKWDFAVNDDLADPDPS